MNRFRLSALSLFPLFVIAVALPPIHAAKVRVEDPARAAELINNGGRLVGDYETFSVVETDAAVPSGNGIESLDYTEVIELHAGAVDTRSSDVRAGRKLSGGFSGRRLHLVQFAGPVKPEWFAALTKTRVQVVNYIPHNAYLVYGSESELAAVRALASVEPALRFEGTYLDADKIHPRARATPGKRSAVGAGDQYQIQLVVDAEANADTVAMIESIQLAPIVRRHTSGKFLNIVVRLPADMLEVVATQPDVVSIWPYNTPQKLDERQDIILTGQLTGNLPSGPGYLAWLTNKGFSQAQFDASALVVDVTDSGLDVGTTNVNHFALWRTGSTSTAPRVRYVRLEGTPNTGSTLQGCDGHGNLNAHIIGGYVTLTNFPHTDSSGYRYGLGVAPFVKVGSSVIFDSNSFTSPDYEDLAARAYRDGARVSGNSWGADTAGGYDADAQAYDAIVRDAQQAGSAVPSNGNQQMTFVFAAGNAGSGASTVGSPGTAKNVITVGAAENVHSHATTNGGNNAAGNDGCDTPDAEANSANDVATFSSRGPCSDLRKKPEIMAPGTHVTGGVGQNVKTMSGNGTALTCFDGTGVCALPGGGTVGSTNNFFPLGQKWYSTSSGTSHSTPAVAGGAALVYQWFINTFGTPPSPAMIKAFLMNSARYMNGTGANDSLYSNNQGMGMMNLGTAFDGTPRLYRDQLTNDLFTASGQQRTFTGVVVSNSLPLRITLTWTDAPGATSGNSYNNDLNLVVVANGLTYRGNVFSGANSATGGSADPRNNAESVFLPAGVTGTVVVTVSANNINSDGVPNFGTALDQDFALVAYNFTEVQMPAVTLVGSQISAESCGIGNGAPDPDEVITVRFALQNLGTAPTTNVVATLQSSGGVTVPSGAQSYGALTVGGSAVTNNFSFTATGACGGTVTATLTLQDGAASLGTVVQTFTIGGTTAATTTNSNSSAITIVDEASATPYPSTINVSGIAGSVSKVTVTLLGYTHTFPEDVDALLVGPGGESVALMGAVGADVPVNNATLTFDDAAASEIGASITSGTYKPSGSIAAMNSPAPAGPYGSEMAVFNGVSPNGAWKLYILDAGPADTGNVSGGWRLAITAGEPLCCASNQPPLLSSIGAKSVVESNALVFSVTAIDPTDGDTIVMGASNVPAGAVFTTVTNVAGVTNTFTWSNPEPVGVYTTLFWAVDENGMDTESVVINVSLTPVIDTNCGVIFSEYVEGTSNNKAVEVFNPGPDALSLATSNYIVQIYANGSGTPSSSIALTGNIPAGEGYVLTHSSAGATLLALADQTSGALTFNGDDAVVLRIGGTSGTVVDVIGVVGTDPGAEWGVGLTSTADNTLRRKSSVGRGDTNSVDAFDPSVEWDGYAVDTFTDLGTHTTDCGGAPPAETPPTIAPVSDQSVQLSNSLSFLVVVTPTDGDAVTITASNLPAGASFGVTNTVGYFSWNLAAPAGVYTASIHAVDNDGESVENVVITVIEGGVGGMETFTNLDAPTGAYGDGDYIGDNGITWFYNGARKPTETNYIVDGQAIGFGDSTRTSRQVYSETMAGGIGSMSVKYLKYFSGAGTRSFDLYVNTQLVLTVGTITNTTAETQTVAGIDIPGDVVIRVVGTGGKQFVVDSLSWTSFAGGPDPDADADGMLDVWETDNFGSTTNAGVGTDFDGDDFIDLHEFLAGTQPTNDVSLLRFEATAEAGGRVVYWQSITNKNYTVSRTTNMLLVGMSGIASNVPGTPPQNAFTDSAANASGFYRIDLE